MKNKLFEEQCRQAFSQYPLLGKFAVLSHQYTCPFLGDLYSQWEALSIDNEWIGWLGPQHGFDQTEQDNMIETEDRVWQKGEKILPILSLYGPRWDPSHLNIDTLIIHLPDVGCRVYTYMSTLAMCVSWAVSKKIRILVWDHPNPLGLIHHKSGQIHHAGGPRFVEKDTSYLSLFDIPLRHGLTLGELGLWFIAQKNLSIDYHVIPVPYLYRTMGLAAIKDIFHRFYPFFFPSPNLPSWEATLFFLPFVLVEATTMSEGRGTTKPFQIFGDPDPLIQTYTFPFQGDWMHFQPSRFRPQFNKHQNQICYGFYGFLSPDLPGSCSWEWMGIEFVLWALKNCTNVHLRTHPYEYGRLSAFEQILGTPSWIDLFKRVKDLSDTDIQKLFKVCQKEDVSTTIAFWKELRDHNLLIYPDSLT